MTKEALKSEGKINFKQCWAQWIAMKKKEEIGSFSHNVFQEKL